MKSYEDELYYIPENFAQEGYVRNFKIVNVIEACVLAALIGVIVYYLPIDAKTTKIAVFIVAAGFPVLLSLNGISGDCLTKTLINFVHYRKQAKVYGPPSETYRRVFMRKKLLKEFKQSNKNRKEDKKNAEKGKLRKGSKKAEETVSSTVGSETGGGQRESAQRSRGQDEADKGKSEINRKGKRKH